MHRTLLLPIAALVVPLVAMVWAVTSNRLPPADFRFNNHTEIKTVDPALVNGQPEGRIINALYEGLVGLDPKDRMPNKNGAARDWDVSDDLRTYTFYIRPEARWSNGDPVTAEDYHYSLRRFLHPLTAAEYASAPGTSRTERITPPAARASNRAIRWKFNCICRETCRKPGRAKCLFGKLVSKSPEQMPDDQEAAKKITQQFVVEMDGKQRTFVMVDPRYGEKVPEGAEACRSITLDFREVGVKVLGKLTLEITLESPTPYWPQLLGFYPLFPVHRGCLEEHGAPEWTEPENLVCNGPYRLEFRRPRDRIRLVKNEQYWNADAVQLEVVDAFAVEHRITSLNMYERGELDWVNQIPGTVVPDLMKQAKNGERKDFNPAPMLAAYYYKLNTNRKPLDNPKVRQALTFALDRQEIIDIAMQGPEKPAFHLVPPGVAGYESPTFGKEDVAKAKALLAEAGFPEGRGFPRLEILYNTDDTHEAVAEMIRKQWQQNLGITVTLQNESWSSYQDRLRAMEYDVGRQAWIGDYIDPNTYLDLFLEDNENNQTGWSDPKYEAMIERAKTIRDPAERFEVLREAEAMLMEELPIVPIYHYVSRNLVKPHVRGFYNNLQDTHPLNYMWIDREQKSPNTFLNRDAR